MHLDDLDRPPAPTPGPDAASATPPPVEATVAPELPAPAEGAETAPPPPASPEGPRAWQRALRAVTRTSAGIEAFVSRATASLPVWLARPALICICAAAGVWMLRHQSRIAELNTNKLTEPERLGALKWLAVTVAIYVAVFVAIVVARRVIERSWRFMHTGAAMGRWLSFAIGLPFVALLRLPQIEQQSPKLSIVFATFAAAACLPTFLAIVEALEPRPQGGDEKADGPSWLERLSNAGRWAAPAAVAALWAGFGWAFSRMAITNHHALNTRTTDLGYYDNIFWQSIHGNPLGCSFLKTGNHASAHFDPLLVLLSPIYLISQRAETILVLQSVWLGAGVVPIYLLATNKLRSRFAGVALALCYALYPALHGATMYEFHSLSLVAPMILWLLYFLETGRATGYWITFGLLLLLREDIPLLLCFVGLYSILRRRPGSTWQGLTTIGISLVYFVVVKKFFMSSEELLNTGSKESYGFGYYYDAMIPNKNGAGGLVTSLLSNPAFVLKHVIEEAKIQFLLLLFLPLGFLPFLAKPGRVMLIYGLVFCLLASRTAVFTIHFQYSTLLFAVAFALTPIGLARLADSPVPQMLRLDGRRLSRALLGTMVAVTLMLSWKFGALAENASFRGGFVRITRELTPEQRETYAWVSAQVKSIPRKAAVSATPKLGPHISNRREAYFYSDRKRVEYSFVDEGELKGGDLERHQKELEKGRLVEISRRGKLVLFKRK